MLFSSPSPFFVGMNQVRLYSNCSKNPRETSVWINNVQSLGANEYAVVQNEFKFHASYVETIKPHILE